MSVSDALRDWLIQPVLDKLMTVEATMADVSQVLNEVAAGLRGPLATSIQALIASEAAARARVAELEGEDVAESAAAADVKAAFDEVAGVFAAPELPDVPELPAEPEPTPDPEAPAEG